MKKYIKDYNKFVKKPIKEQIKIIAKNYCEYHNITLKAYRGKSRRLVDKFHYDLNNMSILYTTEVQAKALGISERTILKRIKTYRP